MAAHSAILQALLARERGGLGSHIEISLFDSIAEWMNVPFMQLLYGGREAVRAGVHHATIAPYGAYRCSDGQQVVFAVQNEREWIAFCERIMLAPQLVHDARFRDNSSRVGHRQALDDLIDGTFRRMTMHEASARLEAAELAHGRLNQLQEAAAHPHLRHLRIQTPAGEVRMVAPAAYPEETRPHWGSVPALGEHTAAIQAQYGLLET
jgi:crotonobetainyl-CoA:carnitine CoA-transferase CaiB-like acyl-CoA transferase